MAPTRKKKLYKLTKENIKNCPQIINNRSTGFLLLILTWLFSYRRLGQSVGLWLCSVVVTAGYKQIEKTPLPFMEQNVLNILEN